MTKYFITLIGVNRRSRREVEDVECIIGARNEYEARQDALSLWDSYDHVKITHVKTESDATAPGSAAWCETNGDNF